MKNGWEYKTIGELCDLNTGGTPSRSKPEYFGGKIRWLVSGDIHNREIFDCEGRITTAGLENSNARLLPMDSVMIALNGQGKTRGTVALLRTEATCNQSLVSISPKNKQKLLPEYLFHNLNGRYDEIRKMTGDDGNDRRGLNMPIIRSIVIPVPPIEEQRRIVAILDEAFAAIDKAKANTEQNILNARELFDSYLNNIFSKPAPDWETKSLKDFAEVSGGYSFKSTDFKKDGKYQVLRMGNVRPGCIRPAENPVFIDDAEENVLRRALLKPGDIIITQTGTKKKRDYGFTALVDGERYLLNQRIASIRIKDQAVPKFFLYFSWTTMFKDQFFANETGTVGQGNVGIGAVTDSLVPFCDKAQQREIVAGLDTFSEDIARLEFVHRSKIVELAELKKSILQRAFSGELVKNKG